MNGEIHAQWRSTTDGTTSNAFVGGPYSGTVRLSIVQQSGSYYTLKVLDQNDKTLSQIYVTLTLDSKLYGFVGVRSLPSYATAPSFFGFEFRSYTESSTTIYEDHGILSPVAENASKPGPIRPGTPIKYTAVVTNPAGTAMPATSVRFSVAGKTYIASLPELAPNQSYTAVVTGTGLAAGSYTVTANVDYLNLITEVSEANNERSSTFPVVM